MNNVFEKTVEAAKQAGATYPKAVAELIRDKLSVENSLAGQQVFVRNGLCRESLGVAIDRLKQSEKAKPLFGDGKVNVRLLDVGEYIAIRKHNPELFGLRKKRRFV
ncbi:MAG: hypothetical protein ABFC77_12060 [Thermoguttaceae bacterium]